MAVSFDEAVCEAYALAGYELEVVPKVPVAARARFAADFVST